MEISCPHCTTRFNTSLPESPTWLRCGKCGGRFIWDEKNKPTRKKTFTGLSTHKKTTRLTRLEPLGEESEHDGPLPTVGKAFLNVVEGGLRQRALLFGGEQVSFGSGPIGRDTDMPLKDGEPALGTFRLSKRKVMVEAQGEGLGVDGKALASGQEVKLPQLFTLVVGGKELRGYIVKKGKEVEGVVLKNEERVIWYLLVLSRVGFGLVDERFSFDPTFIDDVLGRVHWTDKGWYLSRRSDTTISIGDKKVAKGRGRPLLPGNEVGVGEDIRLQFDILGPFDPFESFEGDL